MMFKQHRFFDRVLVAMFLVVCACLMLMILSRVTLPWDRRNSKSPLALGLDLSSCSVVQEASGGKMILVRFAAGLAEIVPFWQPVCQKGAVSADDLAKNVRFWQIRDWPRRFADCDEFFLLLASCTTDP